MASSRMGALRFAIGVGLRAAIIAVLAFGAVWAGRQGLWASGLILIGLITAAVLDLARMVRATDRVLGQFIDGVMAEGYERPAAVQGLTDLDQALQRALDRLAQVRASRERRIDFLEAMNDTVAAALIVVDDGGVVISVNRAARAGLCVEPGPLAASPQLGEAAAAQILALPPGGRAVVTLPDHRAMLAHTALFFGPEGGRRRLVALQSIASDLDAVELKAWQDLVRVLAHEMMNSLTPICALSEAMLKRGAGDDEDTTQALEVIARRSAGLMSFIDSYRRLGDLPAPAKTRVSLAEVIGDLDRLMRPMAAEAGVVYASAALPGKMSIDVDADLLQQALINLVKNAIEAARGRPDGRVQLTCELSDERLEIAIADNGPGLAEANSEAAFVPFFTTKSGGAGIGLALSRQIAVAHGGRLDYRRAKPHGAIFRLLLPLS